ncbi:MAG TPA: LPS export ABC transporter permease LptG [Rhodanobacteraceae bacterium]|nr:LPS export ABC transporter permease LptG [Rhodanobacteraceae bacterium]
MRGFDFTVKRVDRLVAIAVLSSVALTWLTIVGFDAFRIFIGELNDVGQGQYTLSKAVTYVLLTVPRRCYEMFSYSALIGGLIGLGSLAGSGELTALRAAGLSKFRICASVVFALTTLTAIVTLVGETIGPYGEQKAQALQIAAKSKDIALAKGGTLWARDGDTVINARRGRARGGSVELSGVRVFEFDPQGRLESLALAARAVHAASAWTLYDVRRTTFGIDNASSATKAEEHWESGLDPALLSLSIVQAQYMTLRDLSRNIFYLEKNHQDASTFRQAYWERLFYPVSVLALAFCAVPFAFGTLRSGGLAKRLFIGMVLALCFYFAQRAIVNMGAVYGVHPAIANLVPPLLLAALAFFYFRRHA